MAIKNSWSLKQFASDHGKMKIGSFVNKETGETFKSCIFVNGDNLCFVAFSSKLGVLSASEISHRADELQVVQLESGNYSLCKSSSNWEDVDL